MPRSSEEAPFAEMKTKPIFLILCFLVVWALGASTNCVCAQAQEPQTSSVRQLQNVPADTCSDCGHSRLCCFGQKKLAVVQTPAAVEFPADNEQAVAQPAFRDCAYHTCFCQRTAHANRAPPFVPIITAAGLKQVLLI
jgi:hypothetical protein